MPIKGKASIDDLYQARGDGAAELVGGEIVRMSPTGDLPNRAAGAIYLSLRGYETRSSSGRA